MANILWLVAIESTGLRGFFGNLPMLSYYGYYAVVGNGDYCLLHWVNGTLYLSGFQGGTNAAYGKDYMRFVVNMLTYNTS